MSGFGDYEPEDGYHPDDPPDVILRNLARRCAVAADDLAVRGNRPDRRALLRVAQLAADLAALHARLAR